MRLLDVGCGWGAMAMHAAAHHGVPVVGVTLSRRQAELAAKRVAEAGLADRVEIRLQDYRDVTTGPTTPSARSACSSTSASRSSASTSNGCTASSDPAAASSTTASSTRRGAGPASPEQLHRPLRLPRRRAARRGQGRHGHGAPGLRGPPPREPARALRPHAPAMGRQPRGGTGTRRSPRSAGPGPGLAALHGGVGPQLRAGRTGLQQVLGVRADGGAHGLPLRPAY